MITQLKFSSDGEIAEQSYTPEPQPLVLQEFECPRCHNNTFGRFEPFVKKGVKRWCSVCGYSETDNSELRRQYYREHRQELWDNAIEDNAEE